MDCVRWPLGPSRTAPDSEPFQQVRRWISSRRRKPDAAPDDAKSIYSMKPFVYKTGLRKWADLNVAVESAGCLGAVGDAVGLLVDGRQARWRGGRALRVALHARQQDAAQRGVGGRVQHQLGREGWGNTMQYVRSLFGGGYHT